MSDSDSAKPADSEARQEERQRLNRALFHTVIDQRIQQAINDGLFDNLPGQGKPLNLDDDVNTPEDLRLGYRMLKSHGFAPPWIEARKDLDAEFLRLEQWIANQNRHWKRMSPNAQNQLRQELHQKVQTLQRLVTTYNLRLPDSAPQLPGVRLDEWINKLGG